VLKEVLAVACAENMKFFPAVKRVLASYRALSQMTTGVSPAKLYVVVDAIGRVTAVAVTELVSCCGETSEDYTGAF
jgi:multidrug efflux pump subunit AcrA (membrane-fusion protein)